MSKTDYPASHPWISFRFETARIPAAVWRQMGECEAMLRQIAATPMSGRLAKELYRLYLSKGAHATTAIEGNTLTEEDALKQMKGDLPLPASREYLRVEVDNILTLCDDLAQRQTKGDLPPLTADLLGRFNLSILRQTRHAEQAVPGKIRAHSVVVGVYRGAPAAQCRALVDKLCVWLRDGAMFRRIEDEHGKIVAGILRAVFGHLYLAWIHPYGDGNGRTARMLEYLLLLGAGIPAPCAQLISNHCNAVREEYYRQLQTARERDGAAAFLAFAAGGLREQLREQLAFVEKQLLFVVWQSYVGEKLGRQKHRNRAFGGATAARFGRSVGGGGKPRRSRLAQNPRSHDRNIAPIRDSPPHVGAGFGGIAKIGAGRKNRIRLSRADRSSFAPDSARRLIAQKMSRRRVALARPFDDERSRGRDFEFDDFGDRIAAQMLPSARAKNCRARRLKSARPPPTAGRFFLRSSASRAPPFAPNFRRAESRLRRSAHRRQRRAGKVRLYPRPPPNPATTAAANRSRAAIRALGRRRTRASFRFCRALANRRNGAR